MKENQFIYIKNNFRILLFVALIKDNFGIDINIRPFNIVNEAQIKVQKLVIIHYGMIQMIMLKKKLYLIIKENKFETDIIKNFLNENKSSYIMRANEYVLVEFKRFAICLLIIIFKTKDYCGEHGIV